MEVSTNTRNEVESDNESILSSASQSSTSTAPTNQLQSQLQNTQPKIDSIFSTVQVTKQKEEVLTQLITKMICIDCLPVSFVENKGFKKLLTYIAPTYKIPVAKTIMLRVDALYELEKQKLIKDFKQVKFMALTTDCWSSRANESYITLTCHYINNTWQHVSRNITTESMEERHTAVNLKNKILDIINEWEIADQCVAIVHDNAANIVLATRELPFNSVCCYAHSLQLVLNKIMDEDSINPTIIKCSSVVSHFKHSNIATGALTNKQMQLGIEKHKLIQSVKTRWNSTYYMLKRLIEQREAIIGVLSDRLITSRTHAAQLMLTEEEWTVIESITTILEPFEIVTNLFSSESEPTISIIMPIIKSLMENFILKTTPEEPAFLKNIKRLLQKEIESRFKDFFCVSVTGVTDINIFDMSTFLDPRFKNKERFIGSLVKTQRYFRNLIESDDDLLDAEVEYTQNSSKKSALDILFPNEQSTTSNEVDMYVSESVIPKNMCPLQWWKNNENKYPRLTKYAKRYLCVPATSVPSERSFSNAGNIVNAKRACLKSDNVKKLCFLSVNL